jgi:hypothetical protein
MGQNAQTGYGVKPPASSFSVRMRNPDPSQRSAKAMQPSVRNVAKLSVSDDREIAPARPGVRPPA